MSLKEIWHCLVSVLYKTPTRNNLQHAVEPEDSKRNRIRIKNNRAYIPTRIL